MSQSDNVTKWMSHVKRYLFFTLFYCTNGIISSATCNKTRSKKIHDRERRPSTFYILFMGLSLYSHLMLIPIYTIKKFNL